MILTALYLLTFFTGLHVATNLIYVDKEPAMFVGWDGELIVFE